jgi:hypothetical protein
MVTRIQEDRFESDSLAPECGYRDLIETETRIACTGATPRRTGRE